MTLFNWLISSTVQQKAQIPNGIALLFVPLTTLFGTILLAIITIVVYFVDLMLLCVNIASSYADLWLLIILRNSYGEARVYNNATPMWSLYCYVFTA